MLKNEMKSDSCVVSSTTTTTTTTTTSTKESKQLKESSSSTWKVRCLLIQQQFQHLNLSKEKKSTLSIEETTEIKSESIKENEYDSGPLFGRYPNVQWRSISRQELRHHPRYLALPPVEQITKDWYAVCAWSPFVRQETVLWDELHQGVLTSSRLSSIIGFKEPRTIEYLSLPEQIVGTSQALNAACILKSPPIFDSSQLWRGFQPRRVAKNKKLNLRITQEFNQKLKSVENPSFPMLKETKKDDLQWVRCSWGAAQEPSTIYSLLEAYPEARIEETGLTLLAGSGMQLLINDWDFDPRSYPLPPMGASPDARLKINMEQDITFISAVEVKNLCPFILGLMT
jgi:hypothetical protein